MEYDFLLRCDSLELKNKHLTETNLEMIDKVKFAEETRDDQIAKWKANYEKLERLKQESDKSNNTLRVFLI